MYVPLVAATAPSCRPGDDLSSVDGKATDRTMDQ
jgi:hypothetical protein